MQNQKKHDTHGLIREIIVFLSNYKFSNTLKDLINIQTKGVTNPINPFLFVNSLHLTKKQANKSAFFLYNLI